MKRALLRQRRKKHLKFQTPYKLSATCWATTRSGPQTNSPRMRPKKLAPGQRSDPKLHMPCQRKDGCWAWLQHRCTGRTPSGNLARPELADYFDPRSFARQFNVESKAELPPAPHVQAPLRIKPACSAEVTNAKATRQRRSEAWGVFHLGPICSQGVQTGYGAICGLHRNSEDGPGIYCRKALTTSELSEEDCRLRLERWLPAGLQNSDWPEGQGRSMHLSLGGLRLVDFSSGKPEAALDRQVNRQAAFAGKKATPSHHSVSRLPLGL